MNDAIAMHGIGPALLGEEHCTEHMTLVSTLQQPVLEKLIHRHQANFMHRATYRGQKR